MWLMSTSERHLPFEAPIVTPDRRLRVFVSSTLEELGGERSRVRDAIVAMHFAPVMFEQGARPHPPQRLYRAYIEQSDIFVGVYWQRYGWVGPGMHVSGLEDEYEISEGMPRLIYVREPAPERDEGLRALLDRVREEGRSSYKIFSSGEELASLLSEDLAVLLTERFGTVRTGSGGLTDVEQEPAEGVHALLVTEAPVSPTEPVGGARADATRHQLARRLRQATPTGTEVLDVGDAMLALFPLPSKAVSAAIALQRLTSQDPAFAAGGVRIGIELYEPSEDEPHYFGAPLGVARQLCATAVSGQILVTGPVRRLVEARLGEDTPPLEVVAAADLPDAITAFAVPWQAPPPEIRWPAPPELSAASGRGSFVGRSDVLERLQAEWSATTSGERRLVCVTGEPGIGKTRLVGEFAQAAHAQGALVLWGRSSEEALVPYQPLVQAFQHYVSSTLEVDLRRHLGESAPTLVRLIPGLGERLPGLPAPRGDSPESERYRLFDAVSSVLVRMSEDAPVLLVLDDLQWADHGTLALLAYLLRDARPAPLMMLLTYRDTEVGQGHPLADTLADLRRERPFARLRLDGLADEEVPFLMQSFTGWHPSADLSLTVATGTRGNPFFVGEISRALVDRGAPPDQDRVHTLEQLGVPEGVREVVERRVHRLSAPAVHALRTASVVGLEFDEELLAGVMGASRAELGTALGEALEAGILSETTGKPGRYVFRHALIRYTLYDGQTASTRATTHGSIAEQLETMYADDLGQHLPELVRHFTRAHERHVDKVATYAGAAGRRALTMLAYEDAVGMLTLALSAAERARPTAVGERADLFVALGSAYTRSGEPADARASFRQAAELAAQAGAWRTQAEAALGYGEVAGFGGVWITFGVVDRVRVRLLEDALSAAPPGDDPLRSRLLGHLAQALYWAADQERMLPLSEEALGMARRLGEPRAIAQALDSRHVALWDSDHLDEREDLAREMLALGGELDDRDVRLEALAWLITDGLERGRLDLVEEHVAAHIELADELHQPYHLWYSRTAEAMLAHVGGRLDDMERLIEEAYRVGEHSHGDNALQCYLVQSFVLCHERDQVATVLDAVAEHAAASPLWAWCAALAFAYAAVDRPEDAARALDRLAPTTLDDLPRDCVWLSMMAWVADVTCKIGDRERAAELRSLLSPYASRVCCVGGGVLGLGPVSRYLGILSRTLGDLDEALEQLEAAHRLAEELHSPTELVAAEIESARTLLLRDAEGDAATATRLIEHAEALATETGLTRLRREVEALAHPLAA
jgi:eukaryotic-like serine/threonine-protein kinase